MRNNLRVLRVKNRLTQAELAKKIGVCRSMYGHIERGNGIGSAEFWNNIQTFFNLSYKEVERLKKNEV